MFGESKIIWKLIVLVLVIVLGLLFIYLKNKNNTKESSDSINYSSICEETYI